MSEVLTPEQVAEIREQLEGARWRDRTKHLLCVTAQAQSEVIQQISNGWQYAFPPNFRAGTWFRLAGVGVGLSIQVEPMPETHQLILYGEVVLPESA